MLRGLCAPCVAGLARAFNLARDGSCSQAAVNQQLADCVATGACEHSVGCTQRMYAGRSRPEELVTAGVNTMPSGTQQLQGASSEPFCWYCAGVSFV